MPIIECKHYHRINCHVCGSAEHYFLRMRTYETPKRNGIYRLTMNDVVCLKCGFVFSYRVPNDQFMFSYYSNSYSLLSEDDSIKPDYDALFRFHTIKKYVNPPAQILEIGSGNGTFLKLLRKEGFFAVGYEPQDNGPLAATEVKYHGARSSTRLFDLVVSYFVLEHVTDIIRFLKRTVSMLKSGGYVVTEVPDFFAFPESSLNNEHFFHFTPEHLAAVHENAGLEVIQVMREASRWFGVTVVARRRPGGNWCGSRGRLDAALQHASDLGAIQERYAHGLDFWHQRSLKATAIARWLTFNYDLDIDVFIWPANDYGRLVADAVRKLGFLSITPIDSSNSKIGVLFSGFTNQTIPPQFPLRSEKKIILLCSPTYNAEFDATISEKGEKASVIDAVQFTVDGINIQMYR